MSTLAGDSFLLDLARVLYLFGPAYAADMVPVVVKPILGSLAKPLDGGRTFRGQPIFGSHKTWRGLICGTLAGVLVYAVQGLLYERGVLRELAAIDYHARPLLPGVLIALGALVGDLVKSFFKRRIGIAPGASWPVFDQLDFFLGASLAVSLVHAPSPLPWLAALPIVFCGDLVVCVIGYWIGLKDAWL